MKHARRPPPRPPREPSRAPAPPPETAPARPPRIYRGELTSALGALGLLVLMFLTKWYGVAGVPDPSAARPAISTAENAWNGLTIVRWIMLLTIVAALGSVVLHASQRSHGTRTDTSRVVFGLGSLTSVLLIYRVLIDLPQADRVIDQKLGAVLGLMCAWGSRSAGLSRCTSSGFWPRRSRSTRGTETAGRQMAPALGNQARPTPQRDLRPRAL